MDQALFDFLSSFPNLSQEEVEAIATNIPVVAFKKGKTIQFDGEIPAYCFFVLKGLVRQYIIDDGIEKTTEFYDEKHGAISSTAYVNQTPFRGYLVCEEDCLLIAGTQQLDNINYDKFPILKAITAQMVEDDLNKTRDKFSQFITSSPKVRYLNLLESRPDLFQRVPLHQIASYLGMTPESLSRIRKRIVTEV